MNHPPHHLRRSPARVRPLSAFLVGVLLVASVPVALWALANPLVAVSLAVVLVVGRTLAASVADHRRAESVTPPAGDRTRKGAPARR